MNYLKFGDINKNNGIFLILHGWGGSSCSWKIFAQKLSNYGYFVVVPDLPGFGKSKMLKTYTIDSYADYIIDFWQYFCNLHNIKVDTDIYLIGHSNGGRLSIRLVNRGFFSIKKLFLNNSAGIKLDYSFKRIIFRKISFFLKKFNFLPGYKFIRAILYKIVGGYDYLNVDSEFKKQTFLNMIGSNQEDEIASINLDTILIWGEKDTYTKLKDGKKMNRLIKRSKLEILKGQKHGIHISAPDILISSILKHI